jgi:hypothetical protein
MADEDDDRFNPFISGGLGDGDFRGIPIVGPVIDDVSGQGAAREAEAAEAARLKAMGAVDTLEGYTPGFSQLRGDPYEMESANRLGMLLGDSRAGQAQSDPRDRAAQRAALTQLQEIGRGGLTAADKAALGAGNDMVAQSLRGQREASLQDLRARGMGGSGAEVAALFGGQQSGANAMAQQSASVLNAAQQRGLQALQAGGSLAGQMRGQGFGEQFQRGQAVDAFNRDNVAYRRGVQERNVGRSNRYTDNTTGAHRDMYGIRERQAAMRTGQYNQEAQDAERRRQESEGRRAGYVTGGMKLLKGDDE